MNNNTKTIVLLLNWNNWPDTLICLKSVQQLLYPPQTIIVCDNGSTDDSQTRILKWAQAHFDQGTILFLPTPSSGEKTGSTASVSPPRFVYLQSDFNRGFAGGNNLGLRWALAQGGYEYFWLLNNDTKVEPNALSALLASSSRDPDVGVWGSTICRMDEPEKIQCAGGCTYSPSRTVFKPVFEGLPVSAAPALNNPEPLDYIYGASFFVKKAVFDEVGLLSEDYFLFYEELDFCIRARRKGYDLGWCRESVVYHKGSASVGVYNGQNKEEIARANYHENLSTLKITRKFFPHLLPFAMIYRFWGKLFTCSRRREFFLIPPLLQAYRAFLTGR